jgi:hypothetical protein
MGMIYLYPVLPTLALTLLGTSLGWLRDRSHGKPTKRQVWRANREAQVRQVPLGPDVAFIEGHRRFLRAQEAARR